MTEKTAPKIVRVFHPTLDSWQDVPETAVADWADAGWLKTKPRHVRIDDATPKPGESPTYPAIPVIEDVSTETVSSGRSGSTRTSGASRTGSRSSGRGGRSSAAGAGSTSSTTSTAGGASAGSTV